MSEVYRLFYMHVRTGDWQVRTQHGLVYLYWNKNPLQTYGLDYYTEAPGLIRCQSGSPGYIFLSFLQGHHIEVLNEVDH